MSGLGKLIKYEFRSIGRIMLPLYAGFMLVSVLLGLSLLPFGSDALFMDGAGFGATMFRTVSIILYVLVAGAVLVVTTVLLIQRFYRNLLGSEGYLCFTLPVSTNAHIANKTISAGIWMVLGSLAGSISGFIIVSFFVTPGEIFREIGSVIQELSSYGGAAKSAFVVIEIIILISLVCGETAIKIYAAIALGQLWSNHRVLGAFAAYICFGIIEGILGNLIDVIFPEGLLCIYDTSGFVSVQLFFLMIFVSVTALGIAYWFVTYRVLDRHLNLQ